MRKPNTKITQLSNTIPVVFRGGVNTGGNQQTSTFAAITNIPTNEDISGVKILFKNKEATPPNVTKAIVAVTNQSKTLAQKVTPSTGNTITEDTTTGWATVTSGGNATFALPAAASSATGDVGWLRTDLIPLTPIPSVDGSPSKLLMRAKLDNLFTYLSASAFANDPFLGNYFESFRASGVDAATTPSSFGTPSAADPNTIFAGLEFYTNRDIVNVLVIGDSTDQGLHSAPVDANDSGTRGWATRAHEILHNSEGLPINFINLGWSGQNTATYQTIGKTAIAFFKPSIVAYSVYSPNDSATTQSAHDAMYNRALEVAKVAHDNGALVVMTFKNPNENASAAADVMRKNLIQRIKNGGFLVLDMTTCVGDGGTPEKFKPAQRFDSLHANASGQDTQGQTAAYFFKNLLIQNNLA